MSYWNVCFNWNTFVWFQNKNVCHIILRRETLSILIYLVQLAIWTGSSKAISDMLEEEADTFSLRWRRHCFALIYGDARQPSILLMLAHPGQLNASISCYNPTISQLRNNDYKKNQHILSESQTYSWLLEVWYSVEEKWFKLSSTTSNNWYIRTSLLAAAFHACEKFNKLTIIRFGHKQPVLEYNEIHSTNAMELQMKLD